MRTRRQHRFKDRERGIGSRFELRIRDLVLDLRLAIQDQRDPFALQHDSTSGNAAPPCETRYAGPLSELLKTGVWIVACPITDPSGHDAGLALNAPSVQAF